MTIEVRLVDDAEHKAWLEQLWRAFFNHAADGMSDYYLSCSEPGRTRGAFDGATVVGTLRSFGTDLTVPGPSTVRASALTAVSVASSHRRQGVLTEMITGDLRDSKARGEPVSILLASEYPIYGRFGYGVATEEVRYEIATTGLGLLSPTEGTTELVDLAGLRRHAPPVYERFRAEQPGAISRTDAWWDRTTRQVQVPGDEPRKGFQAIYRAASGDVEGYVAYEGKIEWATAPPGGTLTVEEMVATTPAAYAALWAYCFGIDLATKTVAGHRAVDEVLPLLVNDARKLSVTDRSDFLWVRILDTCAALSARRYVTEGHLILEVLDELSLASGRVALEATAAGVTCTTTQARAELTVPVQALGAAYLGGVSWSRLASAGLLDEHEHGAVARADRMFVTPRAPWCTTNF